MRIYIYKNQSFQIVQYGDVVATEYKPTEHFEVCDLNGKNIFGSAFFKSIEDAIKELELYIDIMNINQLDEDYHKDLLLINK